MFSPLTSFNDSSVEYHKISSDTRILTGPLTFQFIRNLEETRMNSDDDTFFEDDEDYEYDEEEEEEDEEEEEFPEEEYEEDKYSSTFPVEGPSRLVTFTENPWPVTTFVLMVAGFLVVFAPPVLWLGANRYFLLAVYILMILCGVAITFSLVTWENASGSRLRWAGLTNLIVVIICGAIGTLDTISWVVAAQSIIPGIATPLISLTMVLVVFSIYTLWIVQKNFSGPRR